MRIISVVVKQRTFTAGMIQEVDILRRITQEKSNTWRRFLAGYIIRVHRSNQNTNDASLRLLGRTQYLDHPQNRPVKVEAAQPIGLAARNEARGGVWFS